MKGRQTPIGRPRDERAHDDRDHRPKILAAEPPAADPLQVELMRLANREPIDPIAAVDQPGTDKQHIVT